jgi:hypothetical protein
MRFSLKHAFTVAGPAFAAAALLLTIGLMGCEETQEAADDVSSEAICGDYCDKRFDCEDHDPSSDEDEACVNQCRDSIEDNCGNDYQVAANEKMEECVDLGCTEFWACMVFEAAPECFDFVTQ